MKVNNINQSAAESSFKAKKLAIVTSKLSKNTPPDIIEIYSLSKKDAEFAQKSLAIFNNQTITPDKKGVFYYEPKKSLVNFFKSIIRKLLYYVAVSIGDLHIAMNIGCSLTNIRKQIITSV